jgi:integral membrane protein
MIKKYFTSSLGLLRMAAFLEGLSLIALIFIAVPMKHFYANPILVKTIGPIHGGLFLIFSVLALRVSLEQEWKIFRVTWKLILSAFIPFGTFYMDHKLLKPEHNKIISNQAT